jgi:2-keto-3-deoxy-L-rhamnonate aldolase RhmA
VPQVNSAAEAREAVSCCRYSPQGKRSFGPIRAGNYGRDRAEYVRLANESVFCVIQVENVPSLEKEVEEIVRVPGIDGIWVGPCDMSSSIDALLDINNPRIVKAINKLFARAREMAIPTSGGIGGLDYIQPSLDAGCQWVIVGDDISLLMNGAEAGLKAFREARANMARRA